MKQLEQGINDENNAPPDCLQVRVYFQEKGLNILEAELFFDHYAKWGWKNGEGVHIKSWKKEADDWIQARSDFKKFIGKCLTNKKNGPKRRF